MEHLNRIALAAALFLSTEVLGCSPKTSTVKTNSNAELIQQIDNEIIRAQNARSIALYFKPDCYIDDIEKTIYLLSEGKIPWKHKSLDGVLEETKSIIEAQREEDRLVLRKIAQFIKPYPKTLDREIALGHTFEGLARKRYEQMQEYPVGHIMRDEHDDKVACYSSAGLAISIPINIDMLNAQRKKLTS